MKRKWLIVLVAVALCAVALLIRNGTAERRYVAAVRKLEWSKEWANGSEYQLSCDRMDYNSKGHVYVTDPEQQKLLFDALKSLTYEGKYGHSMFFRADEESYQIMFRGTELGLVSICLLAEPAEFPERYPQYILQYGNAQYDNENVIVAGGEELVRAAREILGSR